LRACVRRAQTQDQRAQKQLHQRRRAVDLAQDLCTLDNHAIGVFEYAGARRARRIVDERHLAENFAGPQQRQALHIARIADENLDPAFFNDVSGIRCIAGFEQNMTGGKVPMGKRLCHCAIYLIYYVLLPKQPFSFAVRHIT